MADLIISLAEVEIHDTEDDCWIVIDNMVLDVTKFLYDYPDSKQARYISGFAGRDATVNDACNTDAARKMLTKYKIGVLPEVECVEQWEIPYPDDTSEEVEDPEVECVLPEVDPPSEEVEDPEVECVLPEVECVLPEMEMTKKDSKIKDGCGCAIM